jgi:hypothetical protein
MVVAGVLLTVAKPAMGGLGARGSKSPSSSAGSLLNMSGWRGRLGRRSTNGGSATLSAATAFTETKGPVTGVIGAMWSLSGVVDAQPANTRKNNKKTMSKRATILIPNKQSYCLK